MDSERYFYSILRGRSPLDARQVFTSTDPKLTIAAINSIIAEGSERWADRDGAQATPARPESPGNLR